MKPIRLIMENFGPFKQEEVDFAQFQEYPLFLIAGKTGAGKTTIFDAMCYALYGETTGGIRQGKEMRSNFADEEEQTAVTFIFDHQGKRYEIIREPEQTLKKKVGEGVTIRPAKVLLTVYDDAGAEILQEKKATEVRKLIEELLHLTVQQFTQIILLPQGEFRKFLNANSNDKEVVLRKLFGTQIYSELSLRLKERKKAFEKQLNDEQHGLNLLFDQVLFAEEYQLEKQELTDMASRLTLILAQNEEYQEQMDVLNQQEKQVRSEKKELDKQVHREQQLLEEFGQQQQLTKELAHHEEQKQEVLVKEHQVEKWRWVEKNQHPLLQLQEYQQQIGKLQEKHEEHQKMKKKLQTEGENVKQCLDNLLDEKESIEEKRQEIRDMETLEPLFKQKEQLEKELTTLLQSIRKTQASKTAIYGQIEKIQEEYETNQGKIQEEPQLLRKLSQLEKQMQSLETLLKEVSEQQKQEEDRLRLYVRQEEVILRLSEQKKASQVLEDNYRKQKDQVAKLLIARLSVDLLPGESCPVCGSKEHPRPHAEQEWTVETIKEAEEHLASLEEKREIQQKTVIQLMEEDRYLNEKTEEMDRHIRQLQRTLEAELMALRESSSADWLGESNGQTTAELLQILRREQDERSQERQQLSEKIEALEEIKATQSELEIQQGKLGDAQKEIEAALSQEEKQQTGITATLTQINQQIPVKWQQENLQNLLEANRNAVKQWEQSVNTYEEQLKHLSERELLETNSLAHVQRQLQETTEGLESRQKQLEERIAASAYVHDLAEMTEELAHISQIEPYEKAIKEFYDTYHRLKIRLEEVEKKLAGQKEPEIEQTLALQRELEQTIERLEEERLTLAQRKTQNQQIHQEMTTRYARLQKEWEKLAELNQLSEVANGDGPLKISLERYVLQVYFAEILRVANQKLMELTNNRYSFELKEEQGSYKSQTGLELNVYDDNVGAARSVNTLSGGESFIAALSLSLSLGEVVQTQAGGISVEAMFIDEGFGSLDEEALEIAMDAFETVESKGRMIGIISHVRELKQRIPQQIQVLTQGTGQSRITYQLSEE
ncbi:AAA family ATPase [Vagococcus elongatus]|uniref:Nuclease SbcCD subunit C n=1 Tax=Vagococcus elongatus TaxID=180344 RepID=A0A430B1H2_9ENTE|nr:SMC family ATPase [Vagococcus elongatus]RSU14072.1 hypothetical protein CBF29_04095 [Vagococcus elongatus]